jgi:hypothetical protein
MRDYLAAIFVKPEEDKVDYGVKGMQWGVTRTRAERAAARKTATPATTKPPDGPESSSARYSRLQAQAKGGGAKSMSDDDLKFFNARTEALAKVNKMNEQNPGWLSETAKKVLQKTAQRQMQTLSDSLADKYIATPLVEKIKDNSAAIKAESKTAVDYVGRHRSKKS